MRVILRKKIFKSNLKKERRKAAARALKRL
jgi:hypothetical protein